MRNVLLRIVAFVVGAGLSLPISVAFGSWSGCALYEATGPRWAQCGYEFEGMGHVLAMVVAAMIAFGWLAQWALNRWVLSRSALHADPAP